MLQKLALLLIFLIGLTATSHAQSGSDFLLKSFEADYYISRNDKQTSIMKVQERIVAEFPTPNLKHGILRAIPKTYQDHTVSLKILQVRDQNGQTWPYTTYEENDNEVLRIGDPDKFVSGEQIYDIAYEQRNVINFQELDELYWDVNGDQWPVGIDNVTARIHIPAELVPALNPNQLCFTGRSGSTRRDCTISRSQTADETVVTVSADNLSAYSTLTFALAFEKGTFQLGPEPAQAALRLKLIIVAIAVAILLPIVVSLLLILRVWRKYGKDPKASGVIVPQYIAPKDFNPLRSDFVINELISSRSVTAAIVELATKHYLVIHELYIKKILKDKKEYELELVRDVSGLSSELQRILTVLFGTAPVVGSRVNLNTLRNKLYTELPKLRDEVGTKLFELGYFRSDPKVARKRYLKLGLTLIVVGVLIGLLVFTIPLSIGLVISGVLWLVASGTMPQKSESGVAAREYLLGLRDYMKLAEKDRLSFSQSLHGAERAKANPADTHERIKLFERLLPYAVLFGLEKSWAKQFEHLYSTPPEWYHGTGAFRASYLAGSLGSFSSVSNSAFSAPSSSGSSGFGGGGSSGGGGGGGGGGSW